MGKIVRSRATELDRLAHVGHGERFVPAPPGVPLSVQVVFAGKCIEGDRPYDWHGQKRGREPFVLLQHTLGGRGRLTFEGRQHLVRAGETMLLCIPHDHRYYIEPGERWEFFYLVLAGIDVARQARYVIGRAGPVLSLSPDSRPLATAASACRQALSSEAPSPCELSRAAYSLMVELMEEHAALPAGGVAPFAEEVARFCRQNLSRPIGVDDMARVARMSRYHFTRRFVAATGEPPGRFLARLRLDAAGKLLGEGGLSIREVAARAGFSDANYFCKVFRKAHGISPGAFRSR